MVSQIAMISVRAARRSTHTVMSKWNATILGPGNSVHENRIYSLRLVCGDSYPEVPPEIWFVTKINLPCVRQTDGKVRAAGSPLMHRWIRLCFLRWCSGVASLPWKTYWWSCAARWRLPTTASCLSHRRASRIRRRVLR